MADKVDALGNAIVIGEAVGFTPKGKVTLTTKHIKNFLYGESTDYQRVSAEKINISCHMVFPVDITKVSE